jgi:photosystem II stability/assembly factor-like uncharacterized protein
VKDKTPIVLRATLALALALPLAAHAGEVIQADKLRQNLYGTCFVTEDEGWAVGDLGRIFHTTNGGHQWEIQDSGTKRPFVAINCVDKNTLYAAGQAGQIAKTVDGGKTWKMLNSGIDRQLLDINFIDANRGMVVGDYGRMARTDDGGATWTSIPVPADIKLPEEVAEVVEPGDVVLYSVFFSDPDHVWVVGEFGATIASDDGGLTFHGQTTPAEATLFGVFFVDNQRGWAVGMESTMVSTSDGGQTWTKIPVDTPRGFSLALYDVAINKESQVGWAVGNNGFLLNSMDGGQTWKRTEVPVQLGSSWFRTVSLLPDGKGFAVGANGLVLSMSKQAFKPLKEQF